MNSELIVEPKDIFTVNKTTKVVCLGETPMTKEELKSLQEEIKYLERTRIWSILTATLADEAKSIMFEKAQTFDDMRTGKAILRSIDLMKKIVSQMKAIK